MTITERLFGRGKRNFQTAKHSDITNLTIDITRSHYMTKAIDVLNLVLVHERLLRNKLSQMCDHLKKHENHESSFELRRLLSKQGRCLRKVIAEADSLGKAFNVVPPGSLVYDYEQSTVIQRLVEQSLGTEFTASIMYQIRMEHEQMRQWISKELEWMLDCEENIKPSLLAFMKKLIQMHDTLLAFLSQRDMYNSRRTHILRATIKETDI